MENIIEIKGLNKSFGDIKAVNNLSFSVRKGPFCLFGRERSRQIHHDFNNFRPAEKGRRQRFDLRQRY